MATEAKSEALEKIGKKREGYSKKRVGEPTQDKRREVKSKSKKEKEIEKMKLMLSKIGSRLKNREKQMKTLPFLRKGVKKSENELINDERMLGMMQCYHFFRSLCICKQ